MKIDVLVDTFGTRVFSAREARVALGGQAKMTLSRLVRDGRLERVGRGLYKVAAPSRRVGVQRAREDLLRAGALAAPFQVALDGPDAVSAWTGGRYVVEPAAPGETVLWLAVRDADRENVARWLESRGWRVGTQEAWPEGAGPKAILRTLSDFDRTMLAGWPVVTKEEVRRMIQRQPAAYEGAEEWLLEG